MKGFCLAIALLFLLAPDQAHANTLKWQIADGAFTEENFDACTPTCGGVTGWFDWDTVTGQVTDFSFSLTGGNLSQFPELVISPDAGGTVEQFLGGSALAFSIGPIGSGVRILRMTIPSLTMLLNDDTNDIQLNELVDCNNCSPYRTTDEGFLTAVPIPAAIWLFISGLAGLLGFKRFRAA